MKKKSSRVKQARQILANTTQMRFGLMSVNWSKKNRAEIRKSQQSTKIELSKRDFKIKIH